MMFISFVSVRSVMFFFLTVLMVSLVVTMVQQYPFHGVTWSTFYIFHTLLLDTIDTMFTLVAQLFALEVLYSMVVGGLYRIRDMYSSTKSIVFDEYESASYTYQEVNEFWFGLKPSQWFVSDVAMDKYITDKYSILLRQIAEGRHGEWKTTAVGYFTHILVLDQFSRNIVRYNTQQMNREYKELFKYMTQNDKLALTYAVYMLDNIEYMSELSWYQKLFVLLPLRHSGNLLHSERVIQLLTEWRADVEASNDPQMIDFFNKFERNTKSQHDKLVAGTPLRPRECEIQPCDVFNHLNFMDILDPDVGSLNSSFIFDSMDICDHVEKMMTVLLECDELRTMSVYTTLKAFFKQKFRTDSTKTRVIVSLSGGIDSMVILFVLYQMAKYDAEMGWMDLAACHVEFQNRDESSPEAVFLIRWCQMLGIPMYYHYVHDAKRTHGVTTSDMRAQYEEHTRTIRFNLYKKAMNDVPSIGVVLGHHKDDVIENVFFNVVKGRGIYGLEGMDVESEQDGVNIMRPLLPLRKSDNFVVSHTYGIPYFNNSTPSWSNRGRFREELLPLIEDIFGSQIHENMADIGKQSRDVETMIVNQIAQLDLHHDELSISFKVKPNCSVVVWRYLFDSVYIPQKTFLNMWFKTYTKFCTTGLKQKFIWGKYNVSIQESGDALITIKS